jgi:ABC-type sulfate transport system permease component
MLMTYGRGRAEQFRVHPSAGSILNFAPPLFLIYLLLLVPLICFSSKWWLLPLAGYLQVVCAEGLLLAVQGNAGRTLAALPLIVLTHVLYGFGFWRGLFTKLKTPEERPPMEVKLEKVL